MDFVRRILIDCKLLDNIFDMTEDDVAYALWAAWFWAAPLGEEDDDGA